jgi:hypothetical protein
MARIDSARLCMAVHELLGKRYAQTSNYTIHLVSIISNTLHEDKIPAIYELHFSLLA